MYADIGRVRRDVAAIVRPPPKQTVPETAAKHVRVPGGGHYDPTLTHALIEPAECVTSRKYEAVIFAGPAQCGKTLALVENPVAHAITTDPQDVMVIQTAKDQARDFSRRRVDRMLARSPDIGCHLGTGDSDDNTFDKHFRSGMMLSIVWPSRNITAGKAIQMVIATDYDRVKDDAGGEGSLFDVLLPRTRTFKSRGILICESSPSRPVLIADWKPSTPHEAPPTKGILGLFNSGDRRRHYCQCQHCGEYWMPDPGPGGLVIPTEGEDLERAEQVGVVCATCGALNTKEHEAAVKASFTWVGEGQSIDRDAVITGDARASRIASFWMPGIAARYEGWESLAAKLIRAERQFERTGEEESLEAVINTGFGAPYVPKALRSETSADDLRDRAIAADEARPVERGVVPAGGRVLVTTVDNQGSAFVVQVHAFGVGGKCWIVDRYSITVSESRRDENGDPVAIAPASFPEDFECLRSRVLEKAYVTEDGREMTSHLVGQDLSGEPGVSPSVYAYWRKMRRAGKQRQYRIVRGGKRVDAPVWAETYPDRTVPGQRAKLRGDVPVLTLNVHKLKDRIAALLKQDTEGEGHLHLPAWAELSWFEELVAEVRDADKWRQVSRRNETLDLLVYAYGLWSFCGGDQVDWDSPPSWCAQWDENVNVIGSEGIVKQREAELPPPFADDESTISSGGDPWLA